MFYKVYLIKEGQVCSVNAVKAVSEEEAFEIAKCKLASMSSYAGDLKNIQLKEVVKMFE